MQMGDKFSIFNISLDFLQYFYLESDSEIKGVFAKSLTAGEMCYATTRLKMLAFHYKA